MAVNNNIEKTRVKDSAERENFFEAIEKDFVAQNGSLVEIADRKTKEWKLSFFDKVKDFFENPYAGLKYLGSRLFGEKMAEFVYELDAAKENLTKAKDNVLEMSVTAVDKTKAILKEIPEDLKNIKVVGSLMSSALLVKNYLIDNAVKAAEMPKDESERMVWWKEIMKSAGVQESELVEKTLLELLATKKNWTDVRDNLLETVKGEKFEQETDEKIESGEQYENWPFTGDKLGVKAEEVFGKMKLYTSELGNIIRDNPTTAAVITGYLGYKMGPSKGLSVAGTTGKLMLTAGLAPLKIAKNNPKKIVVMLIAGRLIQQNTRWDDAGMKILYNTPLPSNHEEFNEFIKTSPIYKEVSKGMKVSKEEFDEAMGIIDSEQELQKTMDEVLENITISNVVKTSMSVIGQTPEQELKYENFKGLSFVQAEIMNENTAKTLKERMGPDFDKYSALIENMLLESRNNPLGEIDLGQIKEFNKYQDLTRYKIEFTDNYMQLVNMPIDPTQESVSRRIGLNPNLSDRDKRKLTTTLKLYSDANTVDEFKTAGMAMSLSDSYLLKFREMIGVVGSNLENGADSPERLASDINEKVKNGETVVVKKNKDFFIQYGGEYVLLPFSVGEEFLRLAMDEDYEVKDFARVYASGLALVSVVGASKKVASIGFDGLYTGVVKNELGVNRIARKTFTSSLGKVWETITYPYSIPKNAYTSISEGYKNMQAHGLKKMMARSSWGEMVASLRNLGNSSKMRYNQLRSAKLMSEKSKNSMKIILDIQQSVMDLYDNKIYTSNLARRYPEGIRDKKLISGLVGRFENSGLSRTMVEVLGKTEYSDLKGIKSISGEELRKLLLEAEIAVDVEKKLLKSLDAPSTMKNLRVVELASETSTKIKGIKPIKVIGEMRQAKKAAELNRIAKVGKGAKLAKTGVLGAVIGTGMYAVSEALSDDEVKESKESMPSGIDELANKIVELESDLQKEVFDFEKLDQFISNDDYEKRNEVMQNIKTAYLNQYNQLVGFMFKNKDKYEGGIDELAKVLKAKAPKSEFKVKKEMAMYGPAKKVLNLGVGTMQIVQNDDGTLEVGRQSVDVLENNLTFMARFKKEGMAGLGKSLLPLVGTYRDFSEGYDAYKSGNTELVAEKTSMGVSGLATDFLLGAKAVGGGAKLISKAGDLKKLEKLGAILSNAADFSKVSKGVSKSSKAGAVGAGVAMGYDIFASDINTFTKIDNG
jgi:hypothetical protein